MAPNEATKYLMRHHGSHERPYAVLDLIADGDMRPVDIWQVVQREWSMFDRIPHLEYRKLFSKARPNWHPDILGKRDRAMYDALPSIMTVYRGLDECNGNPRGLS